MAARLTSLGKFTKWFIIPVALAGLGYFVVGPRVGSDPKLRQRIREIRQGTFRPASPDPDPSTPDKPPVDESDQGPAAAAGGPGIQIETRRAIDSGDVSSGARGSAGDDDGDSKPRRRRRRRRSDTPTDTATRAPEVRPSVPAPSADSTSYAQGATRSNP